MQIGMQTATATDALRFVDRAADLEHAGLDALWVGEAYSIDALTPLAFVAARTTTLRLGTGVLNVYSRTPAAIALSLTGLDLLSGGRAMCGLGASGPQVIEGLHGVPFERSLSRLRDYTEICRQVWRGDKVSHVGKAVRVPLREGSRPMRAIDVPAAGRIPVWWATLGDASVRATAETADGWLPNMFMPERWDRVWGEPISAGLAARPADRGPLQIAADVVVAIGDRYAGEAADEVLGTHRQHVAFYVGAMGPKGRNAYNDVVSRYGFEDAAAEVQDLYLGGNKAAAEKAVPDALLHGTALVGPPDQVRDRVAAYRAAGVTMLNVTVLDPDPVHQIELLRTLADDA